MIAHVVKNVYRQPGYQNDGWDYGIAAKKDFIFKNFQQALSIGEVIILVEKEYGYRLSLTGCNE